MNKRCAIKKISNGAGTRKLTIPIISGEPLPKELEIIGKKIVDVRRRRIHKTLGPGLLEKVYVPIYRDCHELTKRGLKYLRQIDIPINFNVVNIGQGIKRFVL